MSESTVLTGVKPTAKIHLGNYLGAMRPSLRLCQQASHSYLFIADYHALTSVTDPQFLCDTTYDVAATWLACGLDPNQTVIYRQSDVPEIFELNWILSCFTAKGLMNRSHAYKAKVAANEEAGKSDLDFGVNMGLYTYPILMSADILLFRADRVPVGEDQVQHVEIARDVAEKFNRTYGEVLKLPSHKVEFKVVPGLDGRKMSKSYGNTIPLFEDSKKLRKLIMKIKTDSSPPEAPKDPKDSLLFDFYKEFASAEQIEQMKERYQSGVGWGEVKQSLFEAIEAALAPAKQRYHDYLTHKDELEEILIQGAEKARKIARQNLNTIRKALGVRAR